MLKKCERKNIHLFFLLKMETEKHFIIECDAFKENRECYADMLATNSWDKLFNLSEAKSTYCKTSQKKTKYIK